MIAIVCVDDNMGMMFNKRRQSRDKRLVERIEKYAESSKLYMAPYSVPLFDKNIHGKLAVSECFMLDAGDGDFCFIEDRGLAKSEEKLEKIILYKWNRVYPADVYFDIPLEEHGWILEHTDEFSGFSHEKITEEMYTR